MEPIKSSELITNDDGSVFHLHLHPEDLAEQVILVGDPSRVEMIASYFEKIDVRKSDREFCTITGYYKGCLLYTSPSPRDVEESRMPSSA